MTRAPSVEPFARLPGWELVAEGIADVRAGRETAAAALVWIAWPRLSRTGLIDDTLAGHRMPDPEARLYRILRSEGGNAYGRYGGLLRRLVRFEHALDRLRANERRSAACAATKGLNPR